MQEGNKTLVDVNILQEARVPGHDQAEAPDHQNGDADDTQEDVAGRDPGNWIHDQD